MTLPEAVAAPRASHRNNAAVTAEPAFVERYGAALRADGYTLTLARLPQLRTLNHSTITDKERLNAETYYLGQIARELAQTPAAQRAQVLAAHPRWPALCEEYGEPAVAAQ